MQNETTEKPDVSDKLNELFGQFERSKERLYAGLKDALPEEIKRCQELLVEYRMIGPAGIFGATMIQQDIDRAVNALSSGDVIEMLRAYEVLKECQ